MAALSLPLPLKKKMSLSYNGGGNRSSAPTWIYTIFPWGIIFFLYFPFFAPRIERPLRHFYYILSLLLPLVSSGALGGFFTERRNPRVFIPFSSIFFLCVSETLGGGQRSSSYIANPPLSSLASRETFQKKINVWGIRCKCCFFFREIFVKTMISRELITTPAPPLTRYAYSS